MSLLGEVISNLGVFEQIHQQVYGVVPRQGSVSVHRDVKDELEGLVNVLCIEQLKPQVHRNRKLWSTTAGQHTQRSESRHQRVPFGPLPR